jgi:hypothetical protein
VPSDPICGPGGSGQILPLAGGAGA